MIALSYVESVGATLFGTGATIIVLSVLAAIGEEGRMFIATLTAFAAFIAGVGAIVWWIS